MIYSAFDMSMNALTTAIAARPEINKVHQLNQDSIKNDLEKAGAGTKTSLLISAMDATLPTACNMQRP